MQLKVQHSQRKGMTKTIFCLDVRAEYTPDEKDNINKHNLGGEVVYSSKEAQTQLQNLQNAQTAGGAILSRVLLGMNLNITIASLQKGHHIECKDLGELIDAENSVVQACKNVKGWLEVAKSFDGSEAVIDI